MLSRALRGAAAILVVAAACTSSPPGDHATSPSPHESPPPPPKAGYLARVACSIPNAHDLLLRTWRGNYPSEGGQVQFIPIPPNFVDGGINHSGPWNYLQKIPLLFYGPGYIKPVGKVETPATLADVAPTFADLLHFDAFHAPDGHALDEALLPSDQRPKPPKLIITVVWDGGGRDVLDFWKHNHPFLDSLIAKGAWYDQAIVGSSPSSTPPDHATMGTGAFPRLHGVVGTKQLMDGKVVGPWAIGPKVLLKPTLADVYDKAMGNKPLVGVLGTTIWYLGMIGHGTEYPGGDADFAVLRPAAGNEGAEGNVWSLPPIFQPHYRFLPYVNDLPPLVNYFHVADASDGTVDGQWRGHDIRSLAGGFNTPARLPYQTKAIETVLTHEGFGKDDVPDLFFTNYKLIDEIGHLYYYESPEEGDAIKQQDLQLRALVGFLDRTVGRDNYVLTVTADHGHTPNPKFSGGFRISGKLLNEAVTNTFDHDGDGVPVVMDGKPTYLFLNMKELHQNGYTASQVALFILRLTEEDTAFRAPNAFGPADIPPPAHRNDPIMEAAFPTSLLSHLPCLPEARAGAG